MKHAPDPESPGQLTYCGKCIEVAGTERLQVAREPDDRVTCDACWIRRMIVMDGVDPAGLIHPSISWEDDMEDRTLRHFRTPVTQT